MSGATDKGSPGKAGGGKGAPVKARLTSRERPTMYTAPDGSRYLFTGAALNKTMYMHSFTLVQQVQMQKTDDDDDDDHEQAIVS